MLKKNTSSLAYIELHQIMVGDDRPIQMDEADADPNCFDISEAYPESVARGLEDVLKHHNHTLSRLEWGRSSCDPI